MNTSTLISMIAFLASSAFASEKTDPVFTKDGTIGEDHVAYVDSLKKQIGTIKTLEDQIGTIKTLEANQRPNIWLRICGGLAIFAVGAGGGYFVAMKRSEKSFD